jgi:hypothetical protein
VDANAIFAAIEGVRRATSIAKVLVTSEALLAQAELRLQLADLVSSLADSREALAESAEGLAERDSEILRLKKALSSQGEVVRKGDAYFHIDANGEAFGDALCTYCWEVNHRQIHLTSKAGAPQQRICPNCKHALDRTSITWPKGSG